MPYSKEEELRLWEQYKYQNDREAKKKLIKSLRPLIQKRANQFRNSGIPMTSIELEGMKLASQALDTYDPTKSALNTHVTNYLKKVSRFVTQHQNVASIPEPRALMLGKYKTIYSNLEDEKGREPTISELADAMNISQAEVERINLEQRAELGIDFESDDDEGGGFFFDVNPEAQTSPTERALGYVYFESDPVDKKILEYSLGIGGVPKLNLGETKKRLKLSDSEFNKRRRKLARDINELLD
jgi:RNA polymerase primary sigma factor